MTEAFMNGLDEIVQAMPKEWGARRARTATEYDLYIGPITAMSLNGNLELNSINVFVYIFGDDSGTREHMFRWFDREVKRVVLRPTFTLLCLPLVRRTAGWLTNDCLRSLYEFLV